MSKKVLMINGSFRKKNTYNILLQIAQILKNHDVESEILNLFDYEITDCTGCDEVCIQQGACHIKDGMSEIMQKIMDSDGLVLSSPVYLFGVTSRFKTFADRLNVWFHKPEPAGKPVLFAATTTVTGIKETIRFFDQFSTGFGARKGGYVTRVHKTLNVPVAEKEITKFLSLLQQDPKYYKPTMNEIVLFEVLKVLALKSSGADRQFWEEKKWIDKVYYFDCKMGVGKKLFSRMMFKILTNAMR